MAGWLSRATEAFRTPTPPAPEPYEVGCDCGGRVRGERSRQAQRPPCPSCGRLIFVLPSNVYPRSAKPATKKSAAKPTAAKPKVTTSASASDAVKSAPSNSALETSVAVPARDGIVLDTQVRLLTPFRFAVVVMLTVTSLTAWGLWSRHRLEVARTIVAKATEAGMQALKEGRFDVAARELERARDAVNLLKRTDDESQRVRCLCREAIAAKGLAHDSLFALLHTSLDDIPAASEVRPGDKPAPEARKSKRFDGVYRGNWVVFDAVVLIPAEESQPCTLDMPVFHRGQAVRIEIDFRALRELLREATPNEPTRVIFAAQLERLTPEAESQSAAVLTLKGESAFLWTSPDTHAALGLPEIDDEDRRVTHAILDRQREIMWEVR